jgi:peptidoglycan/xylan/chitin deacetylase (PgdA/CDA1 family)
MWFTTSWDDGHPLDRKLADLMARHGIAGTFYCPLKNMEGLPVMQATDLRALDGPFEIGSHTLEHAYADRMPAARWQAQVERGKSELEGALGHGVQGFCYPGGKLTRGSRDTVAAAGFAYARTTENFRAECGDDPMRVPTSLQFFPHPRGVLMRNYLARGRLGGRFALATACLATGDFEQRLHHALDACQGAYTTFHLWGHSWEIDSHGLWPQLERFFAHVSSAIPTHARVTNAAALRATGLLT